LSHRDQQKESIETNFCVKNGLKQAASNMTASGFIVDEALIAKATEYSKAYMANYDGSHDFNHIKRVLNLALTIYERQREHNPSLSRGIITLAALLHDVGDKKYLKPGEDSSRLVSDALTSLGADSQLADKVQAICSGVSYSTEVKDPAHTAGLVSAHPELAVVQDADRLDAIGAVGIGRAFAFGGAKNRAMGQTMEHFDEKVLRLEGMMKTHAGREMARERTERLRVMKGWWEEETKGAE
jgi:uncharacterized protein